MAPQTKDHPKGNSLTDLNDYGVEDFEDDPFAPSDDNTSKKRSKDETGLGIDEAVTVAKKPRVANVKLDENRLLSDKGIPRLRRKAGDLKFKGKGHEFSDTARLLSLYQLWLDDLFPKAKFLDALAMVEKAGHKSRMRMARMEWIDETKPKQAQNDNDAEQKEEAGREHAKFPARIAPIFENAARKTPAVDSLFGDDDDDVDLFNATPRRQKAQVAALPAGDWMFRNGGGSASANGGEPDEDDLEALMAEEAAQRAVPKSLFGNGGPAPRPQDPDDEEDLDALIAEAEAESAAKKAPATHAPKPTKPPADDDDLDALLAEAEAQGFRSAAKPTERPKTSEARPVAIKDVDVDEEEAMAEMDGLW